MTSTDRSFVKREITYLLRTLRHVRKYGITDPKELKQLDQFINQMVKMRDDVTKMRK